MAFVQADGVKKILQLSNDKEVRPHRKDKISISISISVSLSHPTQHRSNRAHPLAPLN
jgi:hypothetical protein